MHADRANAAARHREFVDELLQAVARAPQRWWLGGAAVALGMALALCFGSNHVTMAPLVWIMAATGGDTTAITGPTRRSIGAGVAAVFGC